MKSKKIGKMESFGNKIQKLLEFIKNANFDGINCPNKFF